MSEAEVSRIYLVKTSAGQEKSVAQMIARRVKSKGEPYTKSIKSILCTDGLKGYVFVEANNPYQLDEILYGLRHVKARLQGFVPITELEKYLVTKPPIEEIAVGDSVEITGGPFKSMRARVVAVDKQKGEATVELLEAAFTLPITIYADYLRKVSSSEGGG
ncbi:MAG: transcription elongation factor Spt5 [Candidatus Bathyarchaeia archaeon]